MKFRQTYCVLDNNLRILWVGGDWDEFALENFGPNAVANKVLSTPLSAHIVGDKTGEALSEMLAAVLDCQRELRIDYRCDSPSMMRRYRMSLQPMREDRVLMVHDLRDARTFPQALTPWRHKATAEATKCSFCCGVQIEGNWFAPEALPVPHPEEVRYDLCPDCLQRIAEATQATREGRISGPPVVHGYGPQTEP